MTRLGALILTVAILSASPLAAQSPVPPFVVGVWADPDGIIPFADFDGLRWRTHWPAPIDPAPAAMPLGGIPAAWWGRATFEPAWEVIELNGRRRRVEITGTTSARLGSGCSGNLGLTTDVPANTYTYGTVLAASRGGVMDPVETLTSNTTDWKTVESLLPAIYKHHEAEAWQHVARDDRPNLAAPATRPRLDGAFIVRDDGGEYAYFESTRRFAPRRDQLESLHSFLTGWLWRPSSAAPFQLITLQAAVSDDDGKGTPSFFPLGMVRQGSRRFWLGTSSSYADMSLVVLDVRRAGIRQLLLVDYPGC